VVVPKDSKSNIKKSKQNQKNGGRYVSQTVQVSIESMIQMLLFKVLSRCLISHTQAFFFYNTGSQEMKFL
jgi:hypothetical protein